MDVDRYFQAFDRTLAHDVAYRELNVFWAEWLLRLTLGSIRTLAETCARLLAGLSVRLKETGPVTRERVRAVFDELGRSMNNRTPILRLAGDRDDLAGRALKLIARLDDRTVSAIMSICADALMQEVD